MSFVTSNRDQRRLRVAWLLRAGLSRIHKVADGAAVTRISVAVHDRHSDMVAAFAHAGMGDAFLDSFQQTLDETPGLALLASAPHQHRVIHEIKPFGRDSAPHVSALRLAGIQSSLTQTLTGPCGLAGFLFLNSPQQGLFSPSFLGLLSPTLTELAPHLAREITRPK